MTKDEAIKIIQTEMECVSRPDCDRLACAYCDLAMRAEDVLKAYQMAITALQTDGDCINRQGAIEAVLDMNAEHCVSWLDAVVDTLDALPSVQPEEHTEERTETHACDCISRQAAIDEIEYELEMINSALDSITLDFNARERLRQRRGEAREILNSIQQLPSTQPENSCDGCRYENADDGVLVPCGFCKRTYSDNYERRTDEAKPERYN